MLEPSLTHALLLEQQMLGRGGIFQKDAHVASFFTSPLFVWWPSLWSRLSFSERYTALRGFVEEDRLHCRRDELTEADWLSIIEILPHARELAGTFLPQSGSN